MCPNCWFEAYLAADEGVTVMNVTQKSHCAQEIRGAQARQDIQYKDEKRCELILTVTLLAPERIQSGIHKMESPRPERKKYRNGSLRCGRFGYYPYSVLRISFNTNLDQLCSGGLRMEPPGDVTTTSTATITTNHQDRISYLLITGKLFRSPSVPVQPSLIVHRPIRSNTEILRA